MSTTVGVLYGTLLAAGTLDQAELLDGIRQAAPRSFRPDVSLTSYRAFSRMLKSPRPASLTPVKRISQAREFSSANDEIQGTNDG